MKNGLYNEAQIMVYLKQAMSGLPVSELRLERGMSNASFYKWRAKFGGMDASLISELKAMAKENRRLKRMYAETSMQNASIEGALGKNALRSSLRKEIAVKAAPDVASALRWPTGRSASARAAIVMSLK